MMCYFEGTHETKTGRRGNRYGGRPTPAAGSSEPGRIVVEISSLLLPTQTPFKKSPFVSLHILHLHTRWLLHVADVAVQGRKFENSGVECDELHFIQDFLGGRLP